MKQQNLKSIIKHLPVNMHKHTQGDHKTLTAINWIHTMFQLPTDKKALL